MNGFVAYSVVQGRYIWYIWSRDCLQATGGNSGHVTTVHRGVVPAGPWDWTSSDYTNFLRFNVSSSHVAERFCSLERSRADIYMVHMVM